MPKITIIGAGSAVFTRNIIADILSHSSLAGCHIALQDISAQRLETARLLAEAVNKVFGGGAVLSTMQQMNIGERNARFVLNYLKTEGIPVLAQDLGDIHARRINFFPRTGKVFVRKLASHRRGEALIAQREVAVARTLTQTATARPRVERFGPPPRRQPVETG